MGIRGIEGFTFSAVIIQIVIGIAVCSWFAFIGLLTLRFVRLRMMLVIIFRKDLSSSFLLMCLNFFSLI